MRALVVLLLLLLILAGMALWLVQSGRLGTHQGPGEPARALDPDPGQIAEAAQPAEQRAMARPSGRVLLGAQDRAVVVDDGGDVDVLVRVDPADDDDGHGCFSVHALGPPRLEVAGDFDASLAEAADKTGMGPLARLSSGHAVDEASASLAAPGRPTVPGKDISSIRVRVRKLGGGPAPES